MVALTVKVTSQYHVLVVNVYRVKIWVLKSKNEQSYSRFCKIKTAPRHDVMTRSCRTAPRRQTPVMVGTRKCEFA